MFFGLGFGALFFEGRLNELGPLSANSFFSTIIWGHLGFGSSLAPWYRPFLHFRVRPERK